MGDPRRGERNRADPAHTRQPILRATVADPDFPAVYSVQARGELALAETAIAAGTSDADPPDLEAVIAELLIKP